MADAGKFTYFAGLRSRGEAGQMIAKIGGLKMEVELIDFPTWGSRKSDSLPYMPYITNEDGSIMLEVVDICKHLAVLGGKLDDDARAVAVRAVVWAVACDERLAVWRLLPGRQPGLSPRSVA